MDILKKLIDRLQLLIFGDRTPGYKIRAEGRNCFKYIEGDRQVLIVCEMLTGKIDLQVFAGSIDRWESSHSEKIADMKRREILHRLCQWMDRRGIKYVVDDSKEPEAKVMHFRKS